MLSDEEYRDSARTTSIPDVSVFEQFMCTIRGPLSYKPTPWYILYLQEHRSAPWLNLYWFIRKYIQFSSKQSHEGTAPNYSFYDVNKKTFDFDVPKLSATHHPFPNFMWILILDMSNIYPKINVEKHVCGSYGPTRNDAKGWSSAKSGVHYTVCPKKYAHGFVVLCFVVVMQSFIMNSYEVLIHIHQGCFVGTGAIVRLPQCQWSKPDGYGKISQCLTTTNQNRVHISWDILYKITQVLLSHETCSRRNAFQGPKYSKKVKAELYLD